MNLVSDLPKIRHDWTLDEIQALYHLPFNDLLFKAQTIHRQFFNPNEVQLSTLLSIKTGACPEDCKYCPQSGHYPTDLEKEKLVAIETVIEEARQAKANGSTRFCMGAAWRSPQEKDMPYLVHMVKEVKSLGLETCMTLGMLSKNQAQSLAEAGLDYYNHNLDTSPEFYQNIITTRTYQQRLDTLENVREAGMKVCCGGIIGMGETLADQLRFLKQLANLSDHPESVPMNRLVKVKGTPLENVDDVDPLIFVRLIAVARILMPQSYVRLSAGREEMSEELQAWCFFAGANSIFYGDKLLTTPNPEADRDKALLAKLGMRPEMLESADETTLHQKESPLPASTNPLFYDAMQKRA